MHGDDAALIEVPPHGDCATQTFSERRAAMNVAYFPFPSPYVPVRDAICILVPLSGASFTVTHGKEAHAGRLLVRTPFVSIIPPGQPHAIDGGRQSDVIAIMLDLAFYERTVPEVTGYVAPDLVGRYAIVDPLIREIGHLLHRELQERTPPGDAYLTSFAAVLAVHVARNHRSIDSAGCLLGLSPDKLQRVQRFVGEHLESALTVPQLASVVHMSPFHFARMFKQATGYTPHGYVTVQRIERSKQILRESDRPLVDIAFDIGFKTQGHFTVVFHKAVGMTPRAYRRLKTLACGRRRPTPQQAATADRLA